VLDVICAKEEATLMKELLSSINMENYVKGAHIGLIQLQNDPDAYQDIIYTH
jgi:hypothetical protein